MEVAIENIRVGGGGDVFDGLQNGRCSVDVVWDGAYIHFLKHEGPRKPDVVILPDAPKLPETASDVPETKEQAQTTEDINELAGAERGEDATDEPPKEKKKRKGYTS